eukprot:11961546-Ditylum_brightwellii.AAC.1
MGDVCNGHDQLEHNVCVVVSVLQDRQRLTRSSCANELHHKSHIGALHHPPSGGLAAGARHRPAARSVP